MAGQHGQSDGDLGQTKALEGDIPDWSVCGQGTGQPQDGHWHAQHPGQERVVDLVGSRRVPSDRLDDQTDDQASQRRRGAVRLSRPTDSDHDGARSGVADDRASAAGIGRRTAVRNGAGTPVGHPGR
jgi:hypothetical protein